jgi:hypothetical protein
MNTVEVIVKDAAGAVLLDQVLPYGSPVPPSPLPPPVPSPPEPAWPSFTGTAQFVGISPSGRVSIWTDPALGAPGFQNATDLLNDADRIADANDKLFASVGKHIDVIVFALGGNTDGTGGADHMGCDYASRPR